MRNPCCKKEGTSKEAWSKQEDQKLLDYIKIHGEGCWHSLPKAAGLDRCGKSCRLRWINYLRPGIKRGNFTQDEEDLIIKLHALLGNRWSLIAGRLPGRTDNEVKNYWNTHILKKLICMGIDPNNHKLRQNLRRQQTYDPRRHYSASFTVANSFESMKKDACSRQLQTCCGNSDGFDDNGVPVNNANGCNEEETTSPALNLNLDLNIATS